MTDPNEDHFKKDSLKVELPKGKSIEDVLGEFLRYLFNCTHDFFVQSMNQGERRWNEVRSRVVIVLSHPNSWQQQQQDILRQAVILAGLLSPQEAQSDRLRFVSEGEASLHFCLQHKGMLGLQKVVSCASFSRR